MRHRTRASDMLPDATHGARPQRPRSGAGRAARGLVLGLCLSALNLVGGFLAVLALGGLGAWTGPQFVGFFGVLEAATGIAYVVGPNIWRLPVAEASTSDRTRIRLAASTLLIPHWAALAKTLAGVAMIVASAWYVGVGWVSLALPLLAVAIIVAVLALSLIVARLGVAYPQHDVFFIVIKRPNAPDRELPGISIGGMVVQLILNIGTFPVVKLLPPTILFRPVIGPSLATMLVGGAIAGILALGAGLVWNGRIVWQAPREQQREAEEFA